MKKRRWWALVVCISVGVRCCHYFTNKPKHGWNDEKIYVRGYPAKNLMFDLLSKFVFTMCDNLLLMIQK